MNSDEHNSIDIDSLVLSATYGYVTKMPHEFKRKLYDYLDVRFVLILLASFFIHISLIYFSLQLIPSEEIVDKELQRLQEHFVSFVLETKPPVTDIASAPAANNQVVLAPLDPKIAEELKSIEQQILEKQIEPGTGSVSEGEFVVDEPVVETEIKTALNKSIDSEQPAANQITDRNSATNPSAISDASNFQSQMQNEYEVPVPESESATLPSASIQADVPTETPTRTYANTPRSEAVSKDLENKGLLGLLGSSKKSGNKDDFLSDGIADNNLNDALSGVSKGNNARTSTTNQGDGKDLRGGRTNQAGHLNTNRDAINNSDSETIQRRGQVQMEDHSGAGNSGSTIKTQVRNQDEVMTVVNGHQSTIQACYQRELDRDPNLKGKCVIRFTIDYTGKINRVEIVSSTLNNNSVERCILSRIRRWNNFGVIDKSKGDATFRHVYTFGY